MEVSFPRPNRMAAASDVATWLSFAATAIGLGGLITQIGAINDRLDPFHANRSAEYLGLWYSHQVGPRWWYIRKPGLTGPEIKAGLTQGFCGQHVLHLSRLPLCRPPGKAGWAVIMAIFHASEVPPIRPTQPQSDAAEKGMAIVRTNDLQTPNELVEDPRSRTEWRSLEQTPLVQYQQHACVTISRTTLITIMVMTNARAVFSYSDASGLRAGYASYNGQWYINWPIGQEALVRFAPHDSHSAATDVYPASFMQRADRCAQMVAGVVVGSSSSKFQVAFCGRKEAGTYVLEHVVKGFPGAHGSRHLYNMLGGKVYEVDYVFARPADSKETLQKMGSQVLTVPSKNKDGSVQFIVPPEEQKVIAHALDSLPWNHLSWSIHRGLRDILLAYAKPTMDRYRQQLADMLKDAVNERPYLLEARGWDSQFVRHSMGDMAASAVLAGQGNSGDLVRVVTDVMRVLTSDWRIDQLDDVSFWRQIDNLRPDEKNLSLEAAVALTKVFVLEWSNEFDYQMYHELPISLHFG